MDPQRVALILHFWTEIDDRPGGHPPLLRISLEQVPGGEIRYFNSLQACLTALDRISGELLQTKK